MRNCYAALLLIVMAVLPLGFAQQPTGGLPPLSELQRLDYRPASQAEAAIGGLSYSDIVNTTQCFEGFLQGSASVSKYKEPILTRGATGIFVFKRSSPAIVLVVGGNFQAGKLTEADIGTGVIIDSTGLILTNWHVVADFSEFAVFFKPKVGVDLEKEPAYVAALVGHAAVPDLALLKVKSPPSRLSAIVVADPISIQIAQDIHVIGHPNGQVWSYTTGVVSQIRENYTWQYSDGLEHRASVIQLQTAINPGNSGGPVLDDEGRLLGLIAFSEEGQNLNYAIRADIVKGFISEASALKLRGPGTVGANSSPRYYVAMLGSNKRVFKAAYIDRDAYFLSDADGNPIGLLATTPQRDALVKAWEPVPGGGFRRWAFSRSDGVMLATGSGKQGFPEIIAMP